MAQIVLLTGFSTAGKSTLLALCKHFVKCIDTDQEITTGAGFAHIYDISMTHGPDKANEIIVQGENALLRSLFDSNDEALLVAAGPFLITRDNWAEFYKTRNPFVIHLTIDEKNVYEGLKRRREQQKKILDQESPYFGSWDNDVTTTLQEGKYVELTEDTAIKNIRGHLMNATGLYKKYENCNYDAIALRSNPEMKQEVVNLIKSKLV